MGADSEHVTRSTGTHPGREGSFAFVHKYVDETYGLTIAVKRAKAGISERDRRRFRKEYELMTELSFPYIVRAYAWDDTRDSFTMEYCDETLGEYVQRVNQSLAWGTRKRIALQFLYGLNYLHAMGILHRDISATTSSSSTTTEGRCS